MSRLFISHSSKNDDWAIALRDWLVREGWSGEADIFLDLDPERGIAAGQRWARSLEDAATRCEAVLFLVSEAWLASKWCHDEYRLADRYGKKLFALLIEDIPLDRLPGGMAAQWQIVRMRGEPAQRFLTTHPVSGLQSPVHVFEGALASLKRGLEKAGIAAETFDLQRDSAGPFGWRAVYRGLEALEPEDAAVFFGRNADIVRGIDALRGLAARKAPRLLVILGASGAGKSSFLRAGLWPRLKRDDSQWLPLRPIRAGSGGSKSLGAIEGGEGLLAALEEGHQRLGLKASRASLRKNLATPDAFVALLRELRQASARRAFLSDPPFPLPILCLDQAEELFASEAGPESAALLALARAAIDADEALLLVTIRSDAYGLMQSAPALAGVDQQPLSLGPVPQGEIARVIREPAELLRREAGHEAPLFDPAVVARLQAEIEGEADALPLLAFVLQRLMREHAGTPVIGLAELEATGGVADAIESEAEAALVDAGFGADRAQHRDALRRLFIPRLARIDRDTKTTQRRVSPQADLPADLLPLARALTRRRLLVTKLAAAEDPDAPTTLEVAHEALLRRWPTLVDLLAEDRDALLLLDGVLNAASDWAKAPPAKRSDFLVHLGSRLGEARALAARGPVWAREVDVAGPYIRACEEREARNLRRQRLQSILAVAAAIIFAVIGAIAGLAAHRASVSAERARIAEGLALERLREANLSQSRSLATTVYGRINASDPNRAMAIALEALPSRMDRSDRPYLVEADAALHFAWRAFQANVFDVAWRGHAPGPIDDATMNPAASRIVFLAGNKVWALDRMTNRSAGTPTRLPLETLVPGDTGEERIKQVRFLTNDWLLIARHRSLVVYDLATGKVVDVKTSPQGHALCGWRFMTNPNTRTEAIFGDARVDDGFPYVAVSIDMSVQVSMLKAACVDDPKDFAKTIVDFLEKLIPGKRVLYTNIDGNIGAMVSIKEDDSLVVISPGGGLRRSVPLLANGKVARAVPTPDGGQFVIARQDGSLVFVAAPTLEKAATWPPTGQPVVGLEVSNDNQQIMIAYRNGDVVLLARRTAEEFKALPPATETEDADLAVCTPNEPPRIVHAADGRHAIEIATRKATLVSLPDGQRHPFDHPDLDIRDATFSADGRETILLGEPKTDRKSKVVLGYDAATGSLGDRRAFAPGPASECARISADKQSVLLLDHSNLRLVNAGNDTVRELSRLAPQGVAFTAAGNRVVALTPDGTFAVWDVATGLFVDLVKRSYLAGNERVPFGVDRADRRVLLRRPTQTYAWASNLDTQALIDGARKRAPICIAPTERVTYYLSAEPPDWCIELGKPPYATDGWRQWLAARKAGRILPLPSAVATTAATPKR